ncbi:MAG: DUF429 domain-containing protein [Chloroflexaceae bacterium]|nr:DUF429 domain-containing protein [Chloroflexaceae bacterium]
MICIGLDLAWSPRNPSGVAVLVADPAGQVGTLRETQLVQPMEAIIAYVVQHAADQPAIVAVDAPLRVPNEQGRRPAEAELGRIFARYQAGAHPANRQRLSFDGVVRGEQLVQRLAAHGFHESDGHDLAACSATHRPIIEVYPHAAMVALFGLERTLKYKVKPHSSAEFRLAEWARYQAYLRDLGHATPALHVPNGLLEQDVADLRGRRRKAYEDQVDALLCAYIGLYTYTWGQQRCRTFGTLATGALIVPMPAHAWAGDAKG